MKEKRSYFEGKYCYICKKPAEFYRLMRNKHFYLCNSKECNFKTKVITGFIPPIKIPNEK